MKYNYIKILILCQSQFYNFHWSNTNLSLKHQSSIYHQNILYIYCRSIVVQLYIIFIKYITLVILTVRLRNNLTKTMVMLMGYCDDAISWQLQCSHTIVEVQATYGHTEVKMQLTSTKMRGLWTIKNNFYYQL